MFAEPSTLTVPAESEQAMIVRQFVRLACHRYGCDGMADSVLQVTDELMSNAIEHGSGPDDTVKVGILPTQRGVRIEVHDHSHGRETAPAILDAPSGLQIIESLAADWGVTDEADGTTVWAEMTEAG
jgi:anti-sigma regulatory factor (Ser/Thr protein kinase)